MSTRKLILLYWYISHNVHRNVLQYSKTCLKRPFYWSHKTGGPWCRRPLTQQSNLVNRLPVPALAYQLSKKTILFLKKVVVLDMFDCSYIRSVMISMNSFTTFTMEVVDCQQVHLIFLPVATVIFLLIKTWAAVSHLMRTNKSRDN